MGDDPSIVMGVAEHPVGTVGVRRIRVLADFGLAA